MDEQKLKAWLRSLAVTRAMTLQILPDEALKEMIHELEIELSKKKIGTSEWKPPFVEGE